MSKVSLNQVHVSVSDVDGAVAFYRDVVGLELMFEVPQQSMAFFDLGGPRLYIGRAESPDFVSAPLLYFQVEDIEDHWEMMKGHGVEFVSEPHLVHRDGGSELWMAFFRTPEGHMNALAEERQIN